MTGIDSGFKNKFQQVVKFTKIYFGNDENQLYMIESALQIIEKWMDRSINGPGAKGFLQGKGT